MRLTTTKLACTVAALMSLAACSTTNVNRTMEVLKKAAADKTYLYAHQDALCYGHNWYIGMDAAATDDLSRSDVQMVCGDYPAIVGFDLGGIENADSCNLDKVPFELIRRASIEHNRRGGIVTYSWHPRNPYTGGSAWDVSSDQVVKSILPGGERHEAFMATLKNAADFIESIKDDEGRQIPIIFRPWHEHTGSWFWWGRDLCTTEEYQALWAMTYEYIVGERGINNLVWAYSPGAGNSEEVYMERYPGDEMVDILGLDCYQYVDTPEAFINDLDSALEFMDRLGAEHGKLTAVTEAGLEGLTMQDWWTGVLAPVMAKHTACFVLTWRNACDNPRHFYAPWPGSITDDDFRAFHNLTETKFLKDIQ